MTPGARQWECKKVKMKKKERLCIPNSWVCNPVDADTASVGTANEHMSESRSGWPRHGCFGAQSCTSAGPRDIGCQEPLKNDVIRRWHSWPLKERWVESRPTVSTVWNLALTSPMAPTATLLGCGGDRQDTPYDRKLRREQNFDVKSCRLLSLRGYRTQRLTSLRVGKTVNDN